jgi:hypothetical protein
VKSLVKVNVRFRSRHSESTDRTFLCALTENAPKLHSLILSGHAPIGGLAAITACSSLRAVDIQHLTVPLDQPSFDALSSFPKLADLSIHLSHTSTLEFVSQSAMCPFTELQTLKVTSRLPHLTGFLAFISNARLKTLNLQCYTVLVPNTWRKCISSTMPYATSIRSIELRVKIQASEMSIMGVIEPLLDLKDLEDICLHLLSHGDRHGDHQGLVEGNFVSLASSWPNITRLKIYTFEEEPEPLPTFTSIYTLALHCPQLRVLALAFDLTNLPPADAIPILSHGLEGIDLLHSEIVDSTNLVRLLDRMFPHLCYIISGIYGMLSTQGELDRLRQSCQDVRKHAHAHVRLAGTDEST